MWGKNERFSLSTLCETYLDRVKDKLLAAVLAGLCAFGTLGHAVLGEQTTHHPRPTLVLTVNTLLRTHTLVVLGQKRNTITILGRVRQSRHATNTVGTVGATVYPVCQNFTRSVRTESWGMK